MSKPDPVPTPLISRPSASGPPEIPLLRVLAGRDVLRFAVFGQGGSVELGREGSGLVLTDASVSRRHARVRAEAAGYRVEDLGSRNGTYVNGQRVMDSSLRAGDRLEVGSVPLRFDLVTAEEIGHLQRVVERLEAAGRDPLTGLLTRAWLDERLPVLARESERAGRPLSVIFLDVDHFKKVNDTFGHAVGDDVLRQVARVVAYDVRDQEGCVRYGGEEMVVVLEDAPEPRAAVVADRLRERVARHEWGRVAEGLAVTLSCGVAQWRPGETLRGWLTRADRALYAAKHDGRNCVRRASVVDGQAPV